MAAVTKLHLNREAAHGFLLPCFISIELQTCQDLSHGYSQPSTTFLNTRLNFPFLTFIKQRSLPMHSSREWKGHKRNLSYAECAYSSMVIWIRSKLLKWNSSSSPLRALGAVLEHGSWTQFCLKPELRHAPGPHLMCSRTTPGVLQLLMPWARLELG